jgi:hypothetical protein
VKLRSRCGYEMEFLDFQMIDKGKQIVRASRRGTVRVSHCPAVSTTIVGDEPITCTGEDRDLMLPHVGVAGVSMEKNNRNAVTAGILVKDLRSRNLDESLGKR